MPGYGASAVIAASPALIVVGVLALFALVLLPITVAAHLTARKGRGELPGILLGLILGWIGVAIAAVLSDQRDVRIAVDQERFKQAMYRECEHCKEHMRRDATVCPHCRQPSQPWVLHEEIWWFEDDDGWYWLSNDESDWFKYDPGQDPVPPPTS